MFSIIRFNDLQPLKTFLCISAWGAGAYLGLYVWPKNYLQKDPSWSGSFILGIILYTSIFIPLCGLHNYVEGLGYLSFSISITYIAAKEGCLRKGCCRAHRADAFFNPIMFKSFNWLAKIEFFFTSIILIVMLLINETAGVALTFFLSHTAIRLFAKWYRSNYLNLWHLLLANLYYIVFTTLLVLYILQLNYKRELLYKGELFITK